MSQDKGGASKTRTSSQSGQATQVGNKQRCELRESGLGMRLGGLGLRVAWVFAEVLGFRIQVSGVRVEVSR